MQGIPYFLLVFADGILCFFSPCTLPVIALYLCYISGVNLAQADENAANRWKIVSHSLRFILGLVIVYSLMGVIVSFIGGLVFVYAKTWFLVASGILLIIAGCANLGFLRIGFLDRATGTAMRIRGVSALTAVVQGMTFALLWTPCSGPLVLGALSLASDQTALWQSALVMAVFTLGISVPIFVTALAAARVAAFIRSHGRLVEYLKYVTGVFMIFFGVLLVFDKFVIFTRFISVFFSVGGQ